MRYFLYVFNLYIYIFNLFIMGRDKVDYEDYYYKYKALKYYLKNLDIENLENGQIEGGAWSLSSLFKKLKKKKNKKY